MISRALRTWTAALTAAFVVGAGLNSVWAPPTAAAPAPATDAQAAAPTSAACPASTSPKTASCLTLRRTDIASRKGVLGPTADPGGYGPSALQSAYSLPSGSAGASETVAIVDAFDDPSAEADLAVYRTQYGLPPCTTANGCFRKVDQRGGTDYPVPNSGWASEISLDVDMVSAVCPLCKILLVEADDNGIENLGLAVDKAVALGAKYVSNSYGAPVEDPSQVTFDHHYDHPGVVMTVSSGDAGYGVSYPAASPDVTSVGGTSLSSDGSARGWAERAWAGAGSGCSAFEDKPGWQTDAGCSHRTVADVSAVADPATGVAVYDSYQSSGWNVFGGTSVSAPIIASVHALAGPPQADTYPASYPYDSNLVDPNGLNDVTAGSNGGCSPSYLCTGGPGFDGPSGLGTPNGVAAFGYHAHGTVTGVVTDAASGRPVADADVEIAHRVVATGDDGRYTVSLPAHVYDVAVSKRGYESRTATVTVTASATTTQDVALTPIPRVSVSGVVTDGSGHGWPLYAKVVSSDGTTSFTDPVTGHYRLELLRNDSYTLHVTAVGAGYDTTERSITVGTADVAADFALTVAMSCDAVGYRAELTGATQPFDGRSSPAGWAVANVDHHLPGYAYQPGWVFDNPGGRINATGGTGNFAIVDSDHSGSMHVQDTTLTSPAVDLSDAASPAVIFANDLNPAVNSTATVEVNVNGGSTWTTVWRKASYAGDRGPASTVVLLPPAAHQAAVKVRFHYVGSWSQWWAIDDVFIGNRTCTATAGGLVSGQVTDAVTHDGISGATVTSAAAPGQPASTVATPDDPDHGDGLYWLFSAATGDQQFIASAPNHATTSATASVSADHVSPLDISLSPNGG
jgi:hypothetical protein